MTYRLAFFFVVIIAIFPSTRAAQEDVKEGIIDDSLSFQPKYFTNNNRKIAMLDWQINSLVRLIEQTSTTMTNELEASIEKFKREKNRKVENSKELMDIIENEVGKLSNTKELINISIDSPIVVDKGTGNFLVNLKYNERYLKVFSTRFNNHQCELVELKVYTCKVGDSFVSDGLIEAKPFEIETQLHLPLKRAILSKILGGNESIFFYELPIFVASSNYAEIIFFKETKSLKNEKKDFSETFSITGAECKNINKEIRIPVMQGFKVDEKSIKISHSSKAKVYIEDVNEYNIILSATLKNSGSCFSLLGQKVSGGRRIDLVGRVTFTGEKELTSSNLEEFESELIQWGTTTNIKKPLETKDIKISYFDSSPIPIEDDKFLKITHTGEDLTIEVPAISDFASFTQF